MRTGTCYYNLYSNSLNSQMFWPALEYQHWAVNRTESPWTWGHETEKYGKSLEDHKSFSSLFLLTKAMDGFCLCWKYALWISTLAVLCVYIYIYLFEYRMNQIYMEYYMVGGFCGCSQVSKPNHHVSSNELCLHIFAAQHWALLFGLCPVTSLHMHHLESRDFVFCICV